MEGNDLEFESKITEYGLAGGHDIHAKREDLKVWVGWKWAEDIEERGDL
jgi:hypothetical protein